MEHFHFISDIGKITLPTKEQIDNRKTENGEDIILVLDSSVCIDIRNLVKWKKDATADKNKMFNLISGRIRKDRVVDNRKYREYNYYIRNSL